MKRIEIIKEYCKYCNDLKIDFKKTKSKNDFINNYMTQYIKFMGLENFAETRQFLDNTLKYNNITIKKEMESIKNVK